MWGIQECLGWINVWPGPEGLLSKRHSSLKLLRTVMYKVQTPVIIIYNYIFHHQWLRCLKRPPNSMRAKLRSSFPRILSSLVSLVIVSAILLPTLRNSSLPFLPGPYPSSRQVRQTWLCIYDLDVSLCITTMIYLLFFPDGFFLLLLLTLSSTQLLNKWDITLLLKILQNFSKIYRRNPRSFLLAPKALHALVPVFLFSLTSCHSLTQAYVSETHCCVYTHTHTHTHTHCFAFVSVLLF